MGMKSNLPFLYLSCFFSSLASSFVIVLFELSTIKEKDENWMAVDSLVKTCVIDCVFM